MTATPPPKPQPSKQAEYRRAMTAAKRANRKNRSQRRILHVVERVATVRKVDWHRIFSPHRGNRDTADARVLAMGICAALDVPQFLIARAFSRNWATVYSAEVRCSMLYHENPAFRREWDTLVKTCKETEF